MYICTHLSTCPFNSQYYIDKIQFIRSKLLPRVLFNYLCDSIILLILSVVVIYKFNTKMKLTRRRNLDAKQKQQMRCSRLIYRNEDYMAYTLLTDRSSLANSAVASALRVTVLSARSAAGFGAASLLRILLLSLLLISARLSATKHIAKIESTKVKASRTEIDFNVLRTRSKAKTRKASNSNSLLEGIFSYW